MSPLDTPHDLSILLTYSNSSSENARDIWPSSVDKWRDIPGIHGPSDRMDHCSGSRVFYARSEPKRTKFDK